MDAAAIINTKGNLLSSTVLACLASLCRAVQVGDLVFSPDGLAKRGVLLRHLVMPGLLDEGKAILDWVVTELGRDTYVHIMEQYVPRFLVGQGEQRSREGWVKYDEIHRRPESEVQQLKDFARSIGLWRLEEMSKWETGELAG